MTAVAFAEADSILVPWAAQRIGMDPQDFAPATALGVTCDGGKTIAASIVFNEYRTSAHGNSMQVSIAADDPRWATRKTLDAAFSYPFIQMSCVRLWVRVAKKNKKARALARRLGFKEEGVERCGWDGRVDAVVSSMLSHECRWILPCHA